MIPLSLAEIASCCKAVVEGEAPLSRRVSVVSSDTRTLGTGSLFVALKGDRYDGHAFLQEAANQGAIAAVVSTVSQKAPLPLLVVDDTLASLGAIARRVRELSKARVVGVTGSVGKTTTKEMVSLVLGTAFTVLKSSANENNEIGVSSTLLKLDESHGAAVVEMAMRGPGEIEWLSRVAQPDVALITNIGTSHIGRLGSREAIADAKAEIFGGLRPGGMAILNRDDPFFDRLVDRLVSGNDRVLPKPGLLSFGLDDRADVRAMEVDDRGLLGVRFICRTPRGEAEVNLGRGGQHLVIDSLAAAAAGIALGVCPEAAARALGGFSAGAGRGASHTMAGGALVVDDAYNASPDSVEAALALLAATPGCPRRLAVLGDMLEMGEYAEEGHRRVGRVAATSQVEKLVCVGLESRAMADEAVRAGLPSESVLWYPDSRACASDAAAWSPGADLILIKGSNGTRMGVIVEALMGPQ